MLEIVRPKALLTRLIGRSKSLSSDFEPDLNALHSIAASKVISELGLTISDTAVREHSWWSKPQCILVTEPSERKLTWLRSAAPHISLITARSEQEAISGVRSADGIIGWCTPAMLEAGKRLRWLQMDTAGVDGLRHLVELRQRNILVTNLQRVAAPVIAEHALALLLTLTRKLHHYRDAQRHSVWAPTLKPAKELGSLRGRRVLVVGLGGLGSQFARLAHGLGMQVDAIRASSREAPEYVRRVDAPENLLYLASQADVVVNTLPLTPATRGIFNCSFFQEMKCDAIFVNIARGASVVTDHLVDALHGGRLAGAALDVTDPEPLPKRHPLWNMPNVILTPHIAGRSRATLEREWIVLKENLRRYADGESMLSVVDLDKAY